MKITPTPPPWIVGEIGGQPFPTTGKQWPYVHIYAGEPNTMTHGNAIATVHLGGVGATSMEPEQIKANAELICRAVNSHAELLEALKAVNERLSRFTVNPLETTPGVASIRYNEKPIFRNNAIGLKTELESILYLTQAAIARAEGKAL